MWIVLEHYKAAASMYLDDSLFLTDQNTVFTLYEGGSDEIRQEPIVQDCKSAKQC